MMISAEVNVPSRAPRYMAAFLAALACIGAPAAHAEEEMLRVYMDHARVLKLDRRRAILATPEASEQSAATVLRFLGGMARHHRVPFLRAASRRLGKDRLFFVC